jgi:DMSO reductase family type II enzyme chaperone
MMAIEENLFLRQICYRIFASLFLYPEQSRLIEIRRATTVLISESWQFSAAVGSLINQLSEIDLNLGRAMVNEYNRLFLIRPKAPPYETIYTDAEGQMRGLHTAQLEGVYLNAGLEISSELNELPDHISVELEFMAYLCMKESEAHAANEELEATHFRDLQRSFMGQHLARWFPSFAKRIKEADPGSIYQYLLPAVYEFLRKELDLLGLRNYKRKPSESSSPVSTMQI